MAHHAQIKEEVDRLVEGLPTALAREGHDMVIWNSHHRLPQKVKQEVQQRCGTEEILTYTGMEPVRAAPIILSDTSSEGDGGAWVPYCDHHVVDEDEQQPPAQAGEQRAGPEGEQRIGRNESIIQEALHAQSDATGEYVRLNSSSDGRLALTGLECAGVSGPAQLIDLRDYTRGLAPARWERLQRCLQHSGAWGLIINPDHISPEGMSILQDMLTKDDISYIGSSPAYTDQGVRNEEVVRRCNMRRANHDEGCERAAALMARRPELLAILTPRRHNAQFRVRAATQQTVNRMLTKIMSPRQKGKGNNVTTGDATAWGSISQEITNHHRLRVIAEPDNMSINISLQEATSAVQVYLTCHVCDPPLEPPQPSIMEAALATINTIVKKRRNAHQGNQRGSESSEDGSRSSEITNGRSEFNTPAEAKEWTIQTIGAVQGGLTFGELLERTTTQRYMRSWVSQLIHDQRLRIEPQGSHIGLNSRLTYNGVVAQPESEAGSGRHSVTEIMDGSASGSGRGSHGESETSRTHSQSISSEAAPGVNPETAPNGEASVTKDDTAVEPSPPGSDRVHSVTEIVDSSASGSERGSRHGEPETSKTHSQSISSETAIDGEASVAEDAIAAEPPPPQIRMIICDNSDHNIRVVTGPEEAAPEGSATAQQELTTAISHKVRRDIAAREIKEQTGLSAKAQKEHLYSSQIENCIQANQRYTGNGSIIQDGNIHYIIYVISHHGMADKIMRGQRHKWTHLDCVTNMSQKVKTRVHILLKKPQQIMTARARTMQAHLYLAADARGGPGDQRTLYTTKAFKQGKVIGNLTTGTTIISEFQNSPCKVFHTFDSEGKPEYHRRTLKSDAAWEIACRERSHNCDVRADGTVVTTRVIRKGETLALSYGYLQEQVRAPLVQGGQTEQQQSWEELDKWIENMTTGQQEDVSPEEARKLWTQAVTLGEEAPADITIGSFTARTDRADLPIVLQALHSEDKDEQRDLQVRLQPLTKAVKNRDVKALTIAAWGQFTRVAREEAQRVVASAKSRMMRTDLPEVIDLLKRVEVNNSETAREWERVFLQSTCKALIAATKQDEELRFNFLMCLTYAEEAQEAASKKQMIEEQALRNVPVTWLTLANSISCTLRVHPHHLRSSRIAFSKGAEITIRVRNQGTPTVAKGIIENISPADNSGLQPIEVAVRRADGSTDEDAIADVTPVYRSAQGMYQRTALHRIWKCTDDMSNEFQDVRNFLMNKATRTLDAGSFRQHRGSWEAMRRDKGHPEHTEDQAVIMDKVWGNSYTLAHGPPGTGKSRTAIDVVIRTLHTQRKSGREGKIIIVVPTNVTAQDYVIALREASIPEDDTVIRLVWALGAHWEKRAEEEAALVSLSQHTTRAPPWITDHLKQSRTKGEQDKLERMHIKREKGGLTEGDEAEYYRLRNSAQKRILAKAEILVMTTQQAGKKAIRDITKSEPLALRVIDESGMIGENDLSVALALRCHRTLIIGDHKQLPARFDSKLAKKAQLQSSFADLIAHRDCTMLRHVFRNTLSSITWVNEHIYGGRLMQHDKHTEVLTGRCAALKIFAEPKHGKAWIELDAKKAPESKPEGSTSKVNMKEAEVALQLARKIIKMGNVKAERISVIALYAAQEREIRQRFMKCDESKDVKVGTIDAYQGKENDLVIFLTTRSSPRASEFIKDTHRMNVMLTRHKAGVIGIGTSAMTSCSPDWTALIRDYRQGGGLLPELQDHLEACLGSEEPADEEAAAEAPAVSVTCISIPCDLCMASKSVKLFTTRDMITCKPQWSQALGGIYIEARRDIEKDAKLYTVNLMDLKRQELPQYDMGKRSMAWYVRAADGENQANIRWTVDMVNGTVCAHVKKHIPQGQEVKAEERAIDFAIRKLAEKARLAGEELAQQGEPTHERQHTAKQQQAATAEAADVTKPSDHQEVRDKIEAKRKQQFAAFENRIKVKEMGRRLRKMRIRDENYTAASNIPNLSYLHTGTSEGDMDEGGRKMHEKWKSIANMKGARWAWEIADYPYMKHKEYQNRQEFFSQTYVLGTNDSVHKMQGWWDQNGSNETTCITATMKTRIHLAACVRATALALKDLLIRLHSHHLQESGAIRSAADSARKDIEGVAYLKTGQGTSENERRKEKRSARIKTALLEQRRALRRSTEDVNAEPAQPVDNAALELAMRAMIESAYSKTKNDEAEELNDSEHRLAHICKAWGRYREMVHDWAQGDSGLAHRDNVGEDRRQVHDEQIEDNIQRICTVGQMIRHCAGYITAEDAEDAEKETNRKRVNDLNKEMTRYHEDMVLAQVKKLAHEKACAKIGPLILIGARTGEDAAERRSIVEAWRIAETRQAKGWQFSVRNATEVIRCLPNRVRHATYPADEETAKHTDDTVKRSLLGFLLNVDNGAMKRRIWRAGQPTQIHIDEISRRKQRLEDLHLVDNERPIRMEHHESQQELTISHPDTGGTRWMDGKSETTGRAMERRVNDDACNLFTVDTRRILPDNISHGTLELITTVNGHNDVWRVELQTRSKFIDQFIVIRAVTRKGKEIILVYREQWDSKKPGNVDGFYYAPLEDHIGACDHILAEWWAIMWADNEALTQGYSQDPRVTAKVRQAAGDIKSAPEPKEKEGFMQIPAEAEYITRYVRADQNGIQECRYDKRVTDEDEGSTAHQALRAWITEMAQVGGNLQKIPDRCNVEAWYEEDDAADGRSAEISPNSGTERHLPVSTSQQEDHQRHTGFEINHIDTREDEQRDEGNNRDDSNSSHSSNSQDIMGDTKGPQNSQQRGEREATTLPATTGTTSNTTGNDTATVTPVVSEGNSESSKGDTESLTLTGDEASSKSNANEQPPLKIATTETKDRPTAPTWAEVASARPGMAAPADSESNDEGWTTVKHNPNPNPHDQHQHRAGEAFTNNSNFQAAYNHLHRRKIRRQRMERAEELLANGDTRRFTLPLYDESREDYEDRITRMKLGTDEGTEARMEYLRYEKQREYDEERTSSLNWHEMKARLANYSEFNAEHGGIQEWARQIQSDLEEARQLEVEIFHAALSLPGSTKLTNDAARARAGELLDKWTHQGHARQKRPQQGLA
jgi:hypothetical protein